MNTDALPSPSGHLIYLQDDEDTGLLRVVCIPHGPLGRCMDHTTAYTIGLTHDVTAGGGCL